MISLTKDGLGGIVLLLGCFHHGVHVFRFTEAVSQAHKEKWEETSSCRLEEMVYTNPVCLEVWHLSKSSH